MKKSLLIGIFLLAVVGLLPSSVLAQGTPGTVRYPADVDTLDSLFGRLTDAPQTTLSGTITSGATTVTVVASGTTAFGSSGSLKIDSEIIYYTGKTSNTFTGCVRGQDSTTATTHVLGSIVRSPILSVHHKTLVGSIIAAETKLGSGSSSPATDKFLVGTGAGASAWRVLAIGDITGPLGYTPMRGSNNLSEITTPSTARTNLGLGAIATQAANNVSISGGSLSGVSFGSGFNVSGTVTATAFVGNGAGLTGIGSGTGGVINTGSTTIGADSDSDSVGVIDLQTRATTRFRVLNNGDLNVINQLGINTPDPLAPLHITVTYAPDTTSSQSMIQFKTPTGTDPAGLTHYPFEIYQRTTTFGDDRTDSVGIGFSGAGGSQGMGNLGFLIEDAFAAPPQAEVHLVYNPLDGSGQKRPWTWVINRSTGAAIVTTSAESNFTTGFLGDLTANQINFTNTGINFDVNNGVFGLSSDEILFSTQDGGSISAKNLSFLPFPSDSERTWIRFGDVANGVGLHNSGISELKILAGDGSTLGTLKVAGVSHTNFSVDGTGFIATGTTPKLQISSSNTQIQLGPSDAASGFWVRNDGTNVVISSKVGSIFMGNGAHSGLQWLFGATQQLTIDNDTGVLDSSAALNTTSVYKVSGTQVVSARGAAVADATDAASAITQLNALLARIRAHGLIAP